jgi:aryl-alcohol dehydrogenase-like predicted oxidoreductase
VADDLGATRGAVALAWLLGRPAVSRVITGAVGVEQLEANLKALDLDLSPATLAAIDALFPAAAPAGARR